MARSIPNLRVELRARTGKGAAREARRQGFVPGIVYGGGEDPLPINLHFNNLLKRLKAGRFLSTLFNMQLQGHEDVRVICRSVQRDVVKDIPIHVDFMRLRRDSRVNLFIPVSFANTEECIGIKHGGVLTVVRGEIELVVTAANIPDSLEVDISELDVGDVLTVSQIQLPEGARLRILDRDFVIANISAPSGLFAEEEEDEEEDEFEDIGEIEETEFE